MQVRPWSQPWLLNYQRQGDDALARAWNFTDDQWRKLPPPLPQITYLPPRFGYAPYAERQASVMQVFGINRSPNGPTPANPTLHHKENEVDYQEDQMWSGSDTRYENYSPMGFGGVSW